MNRDYVVTGFIPDIGINPSQLIAAKCDVKFQEWLRSLEV